MQSVCFPLYFAADDRVRLLTKPERSDFAFHFCPLAAMNRRQLGVIPSMPLTMLSKKLGLDKKVVLKRLLRLSAPGIELIDIQYDSPDENGELSLLSTVSVEILDFADWNGLDDELDEEAASGTGSPYQTGTQHSNGAQVQNGSGAITRKPGAARVARLRERRKAESNASTSNSNAIALQNGHSGVTSAENVTLPNGQNGTLEALHPSRTHDDNVQRNGLDLNSKSYKDQDSETLNVTNVIAGPGVTPGVTPPPLSPAPTSAASALGRPPNLRAKILTSEAVRLARLLRDDTPRPGFPQGNIPRHYQLLAVCDEKNVADLVQRALDATERKQRRGGLRAPGAYYCDSLVRMLGERNIHVPTADELGAEPASEVQQLIRESMAAAAPSGAITPLEDIMPEMEDTQ